MDYSIVKTDSSNSDFIKLVRLLDEDLSMRYGELQKQYEKHNKVDLINDVIVIYKAESPVACGAFKEYDSRSVELKRIFVVPEQRRQGLARLIICELEKMAESREYKYALLETGRKQYEAIDLYNKLGYLQIQNYGPYIGNANSICMKKALLH